MVIVLLIVVIVAIGIYFAVQYSKTSKTSPTVAVPQSSSSLLQPQPMMNTFNGYPIGNSFVEDPERMKGQTAASCQQRALARGYKGWGVRTPSHPDPNLRETCFFYKDMNPKYQYPVNPTDPAYMYHVSGCSDPSRLPSTGCA